MLFRAAWMRYRPALDASPVSTSLPRRSRPPLQAGHTSTPLASPSLPIRLRRHRRIVARLAVRDCAVAPVVLREPASPGLLLTTPCTQDSALAKGDKTTFFNDEYRWPGCSVVRAPQPYLLTCALRLADVGFCGRCPVFVDDILRVIRACMRRLQGCVPFLLFLPTVD